MNIFFKKLNFLFLIIIISLTLGLINFKSSIPKAPLTLKASDAVIVLTGDRGKRIEQGYKLIDQTNFNKMFISGVGGSKTVLQKILGLDEVKVDCCIEFGYKAKNTYQNAIEAKIWGLSNHVNSIILVTTDLHMQRALFLFEQITDFQIQPYPVTYKNKIIPLEKLISEYIKYLISRIIFIKKYEN